MSLYLYHFRNALKISSSKKSKTKEHNTDKVFWEKGEEAEKDDSTYESQNPCIPCPVLKPEFVCGSDNHTYSSVCRMEFRNCMHKVSVTVSCKGFCPCKGKKRMLLLYFCIIIVCIVVTYPASITKLQG